MSGDLEDRPEPHVDDEPERIPGGADAVPNAEGDTGAGAEGEPVTPDQPLSAQQGEAGIPDELYEPEPPEPEAQETDNTDEPTG
jgi:hypothetical protein